MVSSGMDSLEVEAEVRTRLNLVWKWLLRKPRWERDRLFARKEEQPSLTRRGWSETNTAELAPTQGQEFQGFSLCSSCS